MDSDLPKEPLSLWIGTAPLERYPKLERDLEVDVAIVGGGITGITTALLLQRAGKKVALLEGQRLAQGETGHTTAHITEAIDTRFTQLERDYGREGSRLAAQASWSALEQMRRFIEEKEISCGWQRVPGYLYAEREEDLGGLHEEYEAAKRAGLEVEMTREVPLPFATVAGVRFANQAQLHIREYLAPLVEELVAKGALIFEQSHVTQIADGAPCKVVTEGGVVSAAQVVMATNAPLNRVALQTKITHYRSYALAARIAGPALPGLFWDTADPYHYLRSAEVPGGGQVLIVGGEDHKTGTEDHTEGCYERLLAYAQERFVIQQVGFRWSGQIIETADGLPYIGRNAFSEHVFVATGYSGNGLTFGTAAAMMIAGQIAGTEEPWNKLFEATRIKPVAAAKDFVVDNAEVAYHLVGGHLAPAETKFLGEVGRGEGKICKVGGRRLAVFRAADGELKMLSPICPHLGCQVQFNDAEKSWDCPCHGSRFTPEGEVVNGPALRGLKPIALEDLKKK
jgi:glycine/D-amino acid oxidase-like deaminating enzyme/nitrite reductase/ring-hydroxylating ferredoxin subunit